MSVSITSRNQSMECAKLLASFFVLFIHVPFPGDFGILIDGIGRFAVPMFFAISGYFNYQARCDKIWKRALHLVSLYILSVALSILWGCIITEIEGGSTVSYLIKAIPDPDEFSRWIIIQTDPFSGQLWYLNSAIVTYLLYWLYVRFFGDKSVNYVPLYFTAFTLFAIYFAFCTITTVGHKGDPLLSSRNAWFTGIPMFTLGIFLRQYQAQIFENYKLSTKKLCILFFIGLLMVIQQWSAISLPGMPLGTLVIIIALLLLLISHPSVVQKSQLGQHLISKFGPWSTWIYILHLIVYSFYKRFLQQAVQLSFGDIEPWLNPLLVLLLSFISAVIAEQISSVIKYRLSPHK